MGTRHDGKARDQCAKRSDMRATDTKPRTGVESATTTDISNSARTHGNEGHDVALFAAGRCVHGAKNNRVGPTVPVVERTRAAAA